MTKLVLNLLAFTGMSHVRKKAFMILFLLGEKGKEIILRKYRKIPPYLSWQIGFHSEIVPCFLINTPTDKDAQ